MKKYFALLLLILITTGISAQYKPIVFGFTGGGGISWMRSDAEGYDNEGVKPMGSWGFITQFFLMENYAIMTGFNVNYVGSELTYPAARDIDNDTVPVAGMMSRRYKLQYVEIPIVLRMRANISDDWKAYGKIGLGTGFRVRSRADDVFTYEGGTIEEEKKDISDDVKLMRQSLIVGGGVEYVLTGSTALMMDITFNNGFIDILNGVNSADPSIDQKATLSFVELSLGIVF